MPNRACKFGPASAARAAARRWSPGIALFLALGTLLAAQTPRRLTQAIDNTRLVQLHGNVHRLARAEFDRGLAPPNRPLHGMMLLLKRSPQQETALQQLLVDQQTPGSAQYHHFLSPTDFGTQFGPAPADLQTVTQWLQGQGFSVDRVARAGNVIEFSGTAGAVETGFHTSIHQYRVAGVDHWANATDPAIPAALTPVVGGVVSLNDFVKPAGHMRGQGHGTKPVMGMGVPRVAFNPPAAQGGGHAIVPGDFAILYNVAPLYSANINGQGQSIAIVGRSDVDMNDIRDFRNLFVPSNPGNLPQVFVNGPDPGDLGGGDEGESDLDLQWSGAVAPNATIDFVVSATTDTTDGVDLSAEYVVDNNLAPVMSTSFDACEADLGQTENSFIEEVYEQAAAQGITVVDSSGDSGVAGCDPDDGSEPAATQGPGVSGLASTPFNVAVGGTQFNEGSGSFWNATNDPTTLASAMSQIPEVAWNESCLNASTCDSNAPLSSSGGGTSLLYPKPSWQSGTGVPNDGVRDVPDVSFSTAAHDGYVVCQGGICHPDASGNFNFDVFAGTSASAPSFAGVMALVNQKTASIQGQADYVLYSLARSAKQNWTQCNSATGTPTTLAGCIFLDTTAGNNSVPCVDGTPSCSSGSSGSTGTLTGFNAGTGYDLVTGLGSMNVANLVNNWSSAVATNASATTLSLSPQSVVHGAQVNLSITVTNKATGGLGPTGDVVLIAQTGGNGAGIDFGTLELGQGGCSSSVPCVMGAENGLPGGSYTVVARYGGDGNFAPSVSNAVTMNVSPEASVTTLGAFETDVNGNEFPVTSATYGDLVFLDSFVEGAAAVANAADCQANGNCINDGEPTGTVSFSNQGSAFAPPGFGSTLPLNTEGAADFPNGVTTLVPGNYLIEGVYSGDASFSPSTSLGISLTVAKAPASTTVTSQTSGTNLVLTATVSTSSLGSAPSGNVTFFAGTTSLGSATLTGGTDATTGFANATATLTVAASAVGQSTVTAQYGGDANYSISAPFNLSVTPASASVQLGAGTTFQVSVTPVNGFSGSVVLQCGNVPSFATCALSPATVTLSGTSAATATATITTSASGLLAPRAPSPLNPPWWLLGWLGLTAAGLAWQRRRRLIPLALVVGLGLAAAACGGSGSSGGGTIPVNLAGTYPLVVTATAGGATAQVQFNLTIQ